MNSTLRSGIGSDIHKGSSEEIIMEILWISSTRTLMSSVNQVLAVLAAVFLEDLGCDRCLIGVNFSMFSHGVRPQSNLQRRIDDCNVDAVQVIQTKMESGSPALSNMMSHVSSRGQKTREVST